MAETRLKRNFRLGTTSFIHPDHIIPNVKQMGPYFDEIELLVFESMPDDVIPSKADVRELKALGQDLNLTYNVHLPVDISLTSGTSHKRQKAADTLGLILDRFAPLEPTTHTLHLDMDKDNRDKEDIKAWEARARDGLDRLVPQLDRPQKISIETLWYDPSLFEAIVKDFGFSVCADFGHHFKYGYDPDRTFERFGPKISLIHLHGVDPEHSPPKDHQGLDRLPMQWLNQSLTLLKSYTGTVSIEVFGIKPLRRSLACLDQVFEDIPLL